MRNICFKCNKPVGNITFSVCDECWNILHPPKNNSAKELLASQPPVMEGKKETLQDVIKRVSPFGTMTISNPKMLIALEDFIGQKTKSLQSEVEQLKGLLRECMNYLEDERAIIEQAVNTDNYACIPDKDLKLIYNQVSKYLSK